MLGTVGAAGKCLGGPTAEGLGILQTLESVVYVSKTCENAHKSEQLGYLLVEQNAVKGFVKVLAYAFGRLRQDVHLSGVLGTVLFLECHVVLQDLLDSCLLVRELNKLLVLRHVLPIVDQETLEMVGQDKLDGWTAVEGLLL